MAHLLGHRGCMESLRADLRDLQAAIADVSSRAGAVRFPSWKFPDRVAWELDVPELLEHYSYTESDPEFTQHSHVVLLELLVDRLLLLLQSFTAYANNLVSEQAVPPAQAVGPSMSAGLTARRYWSSMLKLGAFYQKLLAEKKKPCKKELPPLQPAPQAGNLEKKSLRDRLPDIVKLPTAQAGAPSSSQFPPLNSCSPGSNTSGSSLPRAAHGTAESSRSIPTQATASPPGPCDTCASAQASLHKVGRAISSICQSQNIPSALDKFQAMQETTGRRTLSAMDMGYWASELSKDLSRISKHLQVLLQQVTPLKSKLEESEKQKQELQKQVEDLARSLQAERESQAQQRKAAEQSLAIKNKEHSAAVARLEQDRDALQREVSKRTLLEEVRTTMVDRRQVLELEEKVQQLNSQQESLGQELSTTTIELRVEKAKVASILQHQETLLDKQKLLLQHFDSLDQEHRELQNSLGEAEEDKAKLAEQLEESRQQSRQQLRAQQENISRLEEQARELKERERLLVFFPELHVPTKTQLESTGSLSEDMEQQLQANHIRISILEQENARLSSALAKLKVAAEQGMLKLVPQSQLWSQLGREDTRGAGRSAGWCSTAAGGTSAGTAPVGRQGLENPCSAPGPTRKPGSVWSPH
ncbi:CC157 protein, partial [Eurystomus gularis]|nr:CC157 protein [Eurystomus gularis]